MIFSSPTPFPPVPSVSSASDTQETEKERHTCWRYWWGRSQIIRPQESLVLCKSPNPLWYGYGLCSILYKTSTHIRISRHPLFTYTSGSLHFRSTCCTIMHSTYSLPGHKQWRTWYDFFRDCCARRYHGTRCWKVNILWMALEFSGAMAGNRTLGRR